MEDKKIHGAMWKSHYNLQTYTISYHIPVYGPLAQSSTPRGCGFTALVRLVNMVSSKLMIRSISRNRWSINMWEMADSSSPDSESRAGYCMIPTAEPSCSGAEPTTMSGATLLAASCGRLMASGEP